MLSYLQIEEFRNVIGLFPYADLPDILDDFPENFEDLAEYFEDLAEYFEELSETC